MLLILGLNLDSNANLQIDDQNSDENFDILQSRNENLEWDNIKVISEIIANANLNINDSKNPQIAIEGNKIYVVWQDKTNISNNGDDPDIFYRYFDGSFWSMIQVISEPVLGKDYNIGESNSPSIVVENGKIYVAWEDSNSTNNAGNDRDIFYRCNLTGNSWEPLQVISEPEFGWNINRGTSEFPKIAVENGKIYVVWTDKSKVNGASSMDYDIFYICNLTGSQWEPVQVISEPVFGENFNTGWGSGWPGGPGIAVENGKIYIVWHDDNNTNNAGVDEKDIFYRCNLTGYSWEPIQVISEPIFNKDINIGESEMPSIAVENGKIYVVWEDHNDTYGAGSDNFDIFYICNLTGTTWESAQVISEPVQGQNLNINYSRNSEITVANGKIYVVWDGGSNIDSNGFDGDIFYRCNLSGNGWVNIQVISEPIDGKDLNKELSRVPNIVTNLGKIHVVWEDSNDTNFAGTDYDIFYRSLSSMMALGAPGVTPYSGNTDTEFNFTVTYIHKDNNPPTKITVNISGKEYLMLEANPSDIDYQDGKEYYFKIKNLDIGIHSCNFWASDGSIIFLTELYGELSVHNTPPTILTIDDPSTFEDLYYEVCYEFKDIDNINVGQNCYWFFTTNASWIDFNYTTAILNGTPENDDVGEYWINITINDTFTNDSTNFTLTVLNVNDPPEIITKDVNVTNEDEYYEKYYKAVDVDSPQDSLSWNMQTNASWLDFEHPTAKLSGTPVNNDVDDFWVNISVSDTEYNDYSNFTLRVINVNDPPQIITKNNTTAFEDEFYEIIYKAEDVDNAQLELSWDINTNAKWLHYNISNAVINGTPKNEDVGEYWINITVGDNEYIDFSNFTLTVVNTNDPPMIITEDKTNVTVGELYSINYEAEDIDPVQTTFSWSMKTNASDWLSIDPITGWLIGVPTERDFGLFWINISVTDGESGLDHHNFILKVTKLPTKNIAPGLSNALMTPLEGNIKTVFIFSVHYYDADNDAPSFIRVVIDGYEYELSLRPGENVSNGIYEYRTNLSLGRHIYYFTASDGLDATKTINFNTLEVKKVDEVSRERTSWFWLIWIVIFIIVIIVLVMSFLIMKKRKSAKIPTVRAELIHIPPTKPLVLSSITPTVKGVGPLAPQTIVSEQLPSPTMRVQPSGEIPSEKIPVPTLAPTIMQPQYQLPQATLSKSQKLGLLEERFLRGEVDLETYKDLKAKIEPQTGEDITKDDLEEQQNISDQEQHLEAIEQPISDDATPTGSPELVGKLPQQNLCSTCSQPLTLYSQNNKYYCHHCKKYE
jgi:hypothetical protein